VVIVDAKNIPMENIIYEHKVIAFINPTDLAKELDKMSEEGWELVSVVEERHYFKRPKGLAEYHINRSTGKYERKIILEG